MTITTDHSPEQATESLAARYRRIRDLTEALAEPLSAEDQSVQSMPDASPTKWHRAHTTWFFEEFVLGPHAPGYEVFDATYRYLFNSYYEAVGPRHPRPTRGLVTRPGIEEVAAYRRHVDEAMASWFDGQESLTPASEVGGLVELGLHHEQQHQELLLMDIKHALAQNPFDPAYRTPPHAVAPTVVLTDSWVEHPGGVVQIGAHGPGFSFDNERPAHRQLVEPFALATRPIDEGTVAAFIADGGYRRSELWLSDGWATATANGWEAPMYWRPDPDEGWTTSTLWGRRPIDPGAPACHLSYYEADALARWAGARLPTEAEWECAAQGSEPGANLLDLEVLEPRSSAAPAGAARTPELVDLIGGVWEWTASAYLPYRGFRPAPGAVGEYNGKFMVNQHVLRGGSFATPADHIRPTYRNFFPPAAQWAFSGARLARDLESV